MTRPASRWRRRLAALGCALLGWAGVPAWASGAADAAPPATCPPPLPPAPAAAPAGDRGLLWRLERDGRVSWLYGTLHVGRPAWHRPGPQVRRALQASEVLALEVDLDAAVAPAAAPVSSALAAALPAALAARLAAAVTRACLPAGAIDGLPPLLQAAALSVLEARWLGLDALYGQDRVLAAEARRAGRPVVALETVASQVAALSPDEGPARHAEVAEALQSLDDGAARRVLARLARAWEQGDLPALQDPGTWCECSPGDAGRALLQRLNDARNPGLAEGIAALHAQGRRVFAAVGALHMTGTQALPRLLAERGFAVRRVPLADESPGGAR